ncbi:MAG: cell division protein FtsZ [Alphaproteobacteria bacterium]
MINITMQPSEVQKLSPKITVIGVGGAGGNAVNNMISSNLEGCEFLVCNTDAQALDHSLCDNKLQLGANVTGGLGAGSKPEIGKAAAEESIEDVLKYLEGANMAFVTAGMGGGTGTGAAPVIAKACREKGILTVGVVTKPFHFEGSHRMKMAEQGLEEMQDYVDTLIVIPNQNLFRIANEKTTFAEAFQMADSVLQAGVRGVTDLMVRPGLVNLDFADIRTAMLEMGKAMMGTGEAEGDKRAIEAAEAAINNPLLDDVSMKGAHGVIINVTGGYDMTLFEADEACNRIRDEVDPDANIIFGATFDESLEGHMRVSIVATGIEREAEQNRKDGSGGLNISGTNAKTLLERATPKTQSDKQPEISAVSAYAQSAPAQPVAPSMPTTSFSALQSAVNSSVGGESESGADMYEQARFSAENGQDVQNTAMRGTRYKEAFIPPKPAQPEFFDEVATQTKASITQPPAHMTSVATAPAPTSAQHTMAPSLQLNPPKMPTGERKRAPSLFERITGSVQHTLDAAMGREEQSSPTRRSAPSFHEQESQRRPLTENAPAQGSLNIDSPAAPPKSKSGDEELDIPAFLRRQAN